MKEVYYCSKLFLFEYIAINYKTKCAILSNDYNLDILKILLMTEKNIYVIIFNEV